MGDAGWGFSVWAHNAECVLYHGARDGLKGGQFDLESVSKRPTHSTSENPEIFLTTDLGRSIQQYATPKGQVARAVIPDELAEAMKQFDRYGNVEYVARTEEHVEALNRHLEIKSTLEAIRDWYFKAS